MTNNSSFETIVLNLVDSIRSEMIALNQDLHKLEVNLANMNVLEEKTATLRDSVLQLTKRVEHLDSLIDELDLTQDVVKRLETETIRLRDEMERTRDALRVVENNFAALKVIVDDDLLVKQTNVKDRKETVKNVFLLILGALITGIVSYFTGK